MPYATIADVRAAGLTSASVPDAVVLEHLQMWSDVFDRLCRQWFEPRVGEFYMDGTDSDTLHLGIPIITLDALYLNNDHNTALNNSYYKVYSNKGGVEDDRKNPRIKLVSHSEYADIYTAPMSSGRIRFRKGRNNQRLVGTFGFVEPDGSTPLAIKRALIKTVISKSTQVLYVDPNDPNPGPAPAAPPLVNSGILLEEWTDWHRLKYAPPTTGASATQLPRRTDGMVDLLPDAEVRGILKLYRGPLAIAAPANASWV